MNCRNVTPPANYALMCECEECMTLKALHRERCTATLRSLFPPKDPLPILSDCPNVRPGRRHSMGCSCDLCYEVRRQISIEANAVRNSTDIDEIVIERIISDPVLTVRPSMAERKMVALELRKRGKGANFIAKKIGISPRTVERYFREAGLTEPKLRGVELRKIVKERILEDPILSFRQLAKETGALPTTLSMHHAALVASGELPVRDNLKTRNTRNGHR